MSSGSIKRRSAAEAEQVAKCPACGAANPAPDGGSLCDTCGAILPPKRRAAVRGGVLAAAAGASLLIAGIVVWVLFLLGKGETLGWVAAGLYAVGMAAILFGVLGAWRAVEAVTERESVDANSLLSRTEKYLIGAIAGFVLIAAVAGLSKFYLPSTVRPNIEAAFQGGLDKYLNLVDDAATPTNKAAITGKVLVVDETSNVPGIEAGKISQVHFALPDALRADSPAEVGTVAALHWTTKEKFQRYAHGGTAFEVHAELRLIDAATKPPTLMAKQVFKSEQPPPVPSGDGYAPPPIEEIAAYLQSLRP